MRLLLDENFNRLILDGLIRRKPEIDYVRVQDVELQSEEDPKILTWAAEHDRVLVTHDVQTIPKYAYERITAELAMPGVIIVPWGLAMGKAIEELLVIIECSDHSEYENRVVHIPQ